MGVGYYRNLTLWNNGANPYGCTSYQDDLSIITSSVNGFGYRSDDHSNNANGAATSAPFTSNHFNVAGIIEKITDKDHFKVNLPVNGQLHLAAMPYNIGTGNTGSNLDMQVTLMSNSNTVIGVYNPSSTLDAIIDTFLLSGSYFIRIEGKGNSYAPEYASLGSYNLDGTFYPFGVLPVKALELSGKKDRNNHVFNWIVEADEKIKEQELQVSANGYEFNTIVKFSAATRNFSYQPKQDGRLQYRLHVVFEDGSQYYSNVIALDNKVMMPAPSLESNLVSNDAAISSPSDFDYAILDLNGRLMARGKLKQGRNKVATMSLSKGVYLFRYSNDRQEVIEKFVKQ
jgi:hypothetical protein